MLSSMGEKAIRASRSQPRQNTAPPRKQAGIIRRGWAVPKRLLIRWGTATPTKEMGPAKAVTAAASRLESRMSCSRKERTFTPMFRA